MSWGLDDSDEEMESEMYAVNFLKIDKKTNKVLQEMTWPVMSSDLPKVKRDRWVAFLSKLNFLALKPKRYYQYPGKTDSKYIYRVSDKTKYAETDSVPVTDKGEAIRDMVKYALMDQADTDERYEQNRPELSKGAKAILEIAQSGAKQTKDIRDIK